MRMSFYIKVSSLVVSSLLLAAPFAQGQTKILFHGGGVAPDSGADGAVFDLMVEKYGVENVTYMQGALAADDGSTGADFDGIVISSTLGSGTVRNKYEDSTTPVLQWEEALVRQGAAGNFFMSEGSRNTGGNPLTEITILQDHFITAGFGVGNTIEVINPEAPQTFSVGSGAVGEGVQILAAAGGPDSEEWAIMIADEGGMLLGDGSDGSPEFAASRRVHLFLENNTFAEANDNGREVFSRSLDWLLRQDIVLDLPGDINMDGTIDLADFGILAANMNTQVGIPESVDVGDLDFNGRIDLDDFLLFRAAFEGRAQMAAVPEPTSLLLILSAGLFLLRGRRKRLPGNI